MAQFHKIYKSAKVLRLQMDMPLAIIGYEDDFYCLAVTDHELYNAASLNFNNKISGYDITDIVKNNDFTTIAKSIGLDSINSYIEVEESRGQALNLVLNDKFSIMIFEKNGRLN